MDYELYEIPVMPDAISTEGLEFRLGARLDELAEQRRRWREAGASSEEIARWSAAWLSRQSTTARRYLCH
jgi:hypothetical protein